MPLPADELIKEVVPGSGVPNGPSTRRLLAVLSQGKCEVFPTWLRGEVYRQARRIHKATKSEALAVAMMPEIADVECTVEYA